MRHFLLAAKIDFWITGTKDREDQEPQIHYYIPKNQNVFWLVKLFVRILKITGGGSVLKTYYLNLD